MTQCLRPHVTKLLRVAHLANPLARTSWLTSAWWRRRLLSDRRRCIRWITSWISTIKRIVRDRTDTIWEVSTSALSIVASCKGLNIHPTLMLSSRRSLLAWVKSRQRRNAKRPVASWPCVTMRTCLAPLATSIRTRTETSTTITRYSLKQRGWQETHNLISTLQQGCHLMSGVSISRLYCHRSLTCNQMTVCLESLRPMKATQNS